MENEKQEQMREEEEKMHSNNSNNSNNSNSDVGADAKEVVPVTAAAKETITLVEEDDDTTATTGAQDEHNDASTPRVESPTLQEEEAASSQQQDSTEQPQTQTQALSQHAQPQSKSQSQPKSQSQSQPQSQPETKELAPRPPPIKGAEQQSNGIQARAHARRLGGKKKSKGNNGVPPQQQAQQYLVENKVGELLENMTAQLVFHRPADPRAFLIDYVEKLQHRAKTLDAPTEALPTFFDANNAKAVFRTFDPSSRGWISMPQYHAAMKSLFFKEYNEEPKGYVESRITMDTFVNECQEASTHATMTFKI